MPNNNPAGHNSFSIFAPEPQYGEVTRRDKLAKAVPMVATPETGSALNAPDASQKRAVRPPKPPRAPARAPVGPPPYDVEVASIFAEIASSPGASSLTLDYAVKAARGQGQR